MIIQVYLDADTVARLTKASAESGRSIEELAESAVSEAALRAEPGVKATQRKPA